MIKENEDDTLAGDDQSQTEDLTSGEGDDATIDKDLAETIAMLSDGKRVGDEDELTDEQQAAADQANAKAIFDELTQGWTNATLPDDMIPDDFNAGDPAQLRNLMTKVMRHTMQTVIPLALKPVQSAMKAQSTMFQKQIRNGISNSNSEQSVHQQLVSRFPLLNDPAFSPIYGPIARELQAKKIPLADRITKLNAIAKRLGHDTSKAASGHGRDQASVLTGKDALDSLFGAMPKP